VDNGEDADLILYDAVHDDVGQDRDNQLARAVNPPGSAKVGIVGERIDGGSDCGMDARRGMGVISGDELVDRFEVVERGAAPNDLQLRQVFFGSGRGSSWSVSHDSIQRMTS
jgi:hypothetical protein